VLTARRIPPLLNSAPLAPTTLLKDKLLSSIAKSALLVVIAELLVSLRQPTCVLLVTTALADNPFPTTLPTSALLDTSACPDLALLSLVLPELTRMFKDKLPANRVPLVTTVLDMTTFLILSCVLKVTTASTEPKLPTNSLVPSAPSPTRLVWRLNLNVLLALLDTTVHFLVKLRPPTSVMLDTTALVAPVFPILPTVASLATSARLESTATTVLLFLLTVLPVHITWLLDFVMSVSANSALLVTTATRLVLLLPLETVPLVSTAPLVNLFPIAWFALGVNTALKPVPTSSAAPLVLTPSTKVKPVANLALKASIAKALLLATAMPLDFLDVSTSITLALVLALLVSTALLLLATATSILALLATMVIKLNSLRFPTAQLALLVNTAQFLESPPPLVSCVLLDSGASVELLFPIPLMVSLVNSALLVTIALSVQLLLVVALLALTTPQPVEWTSLLANSALPDMLAPPLASLLPTRTAPPVTIALVDKLLQILLPTCAPSDGTVRLEAPLLSLAPLVLLLSTAVSPCVTLAPLATTATSARRSSTAQLLAHAQQVTTVFLERPTPRSILALLEQLLSFQELPLLLSASLVPTERLALTMVQTKPCWRIAKLDTTALLVPTPPLLKTTSLVRSALLVTTAQLVLVLQFLAPLVLSVWTQVSPTSALALLAPLDTIAPLLVPRTGLEFVLLDTIAPVDKRFPTIPLTSALVTRFVLLAPLLPVTALMVTTLKLLTLVALRAAFAPLALSATCTSNNFRPSLVPTCTSSPLGVLAVTTASLEPLDLTLLLVLLVTTPTRPTCFILPCALSALLDATAWTTLQITKLVCAHLVTTAFSDLTTPLLIFLTTRLPLAVLVLPAVTARLDLPANVVALALLAPSTPISTAATSLFVNLALPVTTANLKAMLSPRVMACALLVSTALVDLLKLLVLPTSVPLEVIVDSVLLVPLLATAVLTTRLLVKLLVSLALTTSTVLRTRPNLSSVSTITTAHLELHILSNVPTVLMLPTTSASSTLLFNVLLAPLVDIAPTEQSLDSALLATCASMVTLFPTLKLRQTLLARRVVFALSATTALSEQPKSATAPTTHSVSQLVSKTPEIALHAVLDSSVLRTLSFLKIALLVLTALVSLIRSKAALVLFLALLVHTTLLFAPQISLTACLARMVTTVLKTVWLLVSFTQLLLVTTATSVKLNLTAALEALSNLMVAVSPEAQLPACCAHLVLSALPPPRFLWDALKVHSVPKRLLSPSTALEDPTVPSTRLLRSIALLVPTVLLSRPSRFNAPMVPFVLLALNSRFSALAVMFLKTPPSTAPTSTTLAKLVLLATGRPTPCSVFLAKLATFVLEPLPLLLPSTSLSIAVMSVLSVTTARLDRSNLLLVLLVTSTTRLVDKLSPIALLALLDSTTPIRLPSLADPAVALPSRLLALLTATAQASSVPSNTKTLLAAANLATSSMVTVNVSPKKMLNSTVLPSSTKSALPAKFVPLLVVVSISAVMLSAISALAMLVLLILKSVFASATFFLTSTRFATPTAAQTPTACSSTLKTVSSFSSTPQMVTDLLSLLTAPQFSETRSAVFVTKLLAKFAFSKSVLMACKPFTTLILPSWILLKRTLLLLSLL
jgi:hypothetical protein